MTYEVRTGGEVFRDLGLQEALAKVRELMAAGIDPELYDSFGDPMGLIELEQMAASTLGD